MASAPASMGGRSHIVRRDYDGKDDEDEDINCCSPFHDEKRSCSACGPEHVGAFLCITVFAAVAASVIAYGPTNVVRYVLNLLPRSPGWGWYLSMGVLTLVSIVTIMPIWPPMCMAAGLMFGLGWGALLNFFSILGAAVVSLTLGRVVLREPVRRLIEGGRYPRTRRAILVLEESGNSLKFQVLFRFLFIPMFVRNYGPSTLDVPLWKLFLGCVPHSAWISVLFASLGSTFQDSAQLLREGKELDLKALKWQQVLVLLVSIIVAVLLAFYAQRKYAEHLESEQEGLLAEQAEADADPPEAPGW